MRLEEYLLKHGVKCKETADYLIKNRLVKINGNVVTYAPLPIDECDVVEVIVKEYMDAPPTFWKMKEIDESTELIKRGDFILDIESPDGGFPLYAARRKANVTLVTIRDDLNFLKKDNIEIKKWNAVKGDPKKIFSSKFDTVMIELGMDFLKSMQLLERLRDFIGSRGKLVIFLQSRGRDNVKEMAEKMLPRYKLHPIEFFEGRKGFYSYSKVV